MIFRIEEIDIVEDSPFTLDDVGRFATVIGGTLFRISDSEEMARERYYEDWFNSKF